MYNPRDIDIIPPLVQQYPPLGLMYLASHLAINRIDVKILDACVLSLSPEQVANEILNKDVSYVGFYTTMFNLWSVKRSIDILRDKSNVTIILGGPHVTHFPKAIQELRADFGVIGDGEIALVELLQCLMDGDMERTKYVPNVVQYINGRVVIPHVRSIDNLDDLRFPDRYAVQPHLYSTPLHPGKMTTMVTSRGCPFDCFFCGLPNKNSFRRRSQKNAVQEVFEIIDQGYNYIEIKDDIFTLHKEWVLDFCSMLAGNKHSIAWGCETRADCVDFPLMMEMKKAGCTNIKFGIEAGSDRVRNGILGKQLKRHAIVRAFEDAKRVGLATMGYFILGSPSETHEEIRETMMLANEIDPDYAEFHLMFPIAGSRCFKQMLQNGVLREDVFEKIAIGGRLPLCVSDNIDEAELIRCRKMAYRSFYFNPRRLMRYVRTSEGVKGLLKKAKAGHAILWQMMR